MTEWVRLAAVGEIPEGQGKSFVVTGKTVAVFNIGGQFHAIDAVCPHKKGPLAEGPVEGKIVTCPWHGWEFDVTTGQLQHDENVRIGCFKLRIENGEILIEPPQP